MEYLSILDLVLPPIALFFIYLYCNYLTNKYKKEKEEYRYFTSALFVRIFGSLVFAFIYLFYYRGGDTLNYFETARALKNLMFVDFGDFFELVTTEVDDFYARSMFTPETGMPIYRFTDHAAMFTSKFYIPAVLFGMGSFILSTIFASLLSFTGLWKLYKVFIYEFPQLKSKLYISIFLIPSVFFWGSGIMKDSITISAIGWYVYAMHSYFIRRERKWKYLVYLAIAIYLLISIKPYIVFALLPGSIIWLSNQYASRFEDKLIRTVFTPFLLVAGCLLAYMALKQVDQYLGVYSIDSVTERAATVNKDLQMSYYGGKSFSIGEYDPTLTGLLSVSHKAIFAALFRPTFLDTQNIVMLFSAAENTYVLILTIVLLVQLKVVGFFRYIAIHPLLLFSVLFALFFAFSVGVSISNFGSLVRLRIPALPFFVSSLFIIQYLYKQKAGFSKKAQPNKKPVQH